MGLGLDGADAKIMKSTEEDLGKITGQKPVITNLKNQLQILKQEKVVMLV
jgi:large subunit ribosomal protein L5